jgi:hypothetical protein
MAISKTAVKVIDNQTVAFSNKVDQATGTDLSSAINLKVGYTLTFNGSATAGARIDLFADPADASANFTIGAYDNALDSEDILLTATNKGHQVSGNIQMNWAAKYVKARLVNLDPAQSITGASVWLTPQVP